MKPFSKFMTNSEEYCENISLVFSSFSTETRRIWLHLATPAMEVCKSLHTLLFQCANVCDFSSHSLTGASKCMVGSKVTLANRQTAFKEHIMNKECFEGRFNA